MLKLLDVYQRIVGDVQLPQVGELRERRQRGDLVVANVQDLQVVQLFNALQGLDIVLFDVKSQQVLALR